MLRLPKPIQLSPQEKAILENISAKDIEWEEDGDNGFVIYLICNLPVERANPSIQIAIQPIQDIFYQVHINIDKGLQGLKLSNKVYESLVKWLGHIYSGKGRVQNPIIKKVLFNLSKTSGITCYENSVAKICISDSNPEKKELLKKFQIIENRSILKEMLFSRIKHSERIYK